MLLIRLSLLAIVGALVLSVAALGTQSRQVEAAPEDDIEAMLDAAVAAWNAGDAATFIAFWTDEGLEQLFGIEDRSEAQAIVEEEMEGAGPIASLSISDLFVTSGNARGIVDIRFEAGFSVYEEWSFYLLDGGWKIGAIKPASRPIPAGVSTVNLWLQEYAFIFDKSAVASGNFAFQVYNIGSEEHEVILITIDSNEDIFDIAQELLEGGQDAPLPAGIDFHSFGGFFEAGRQGTVVFPDGLAAGRYGLICFVSAPDGTPHAALGMVADFTVGVGAAPGGGGTITPPNTGDAGLSGGPSSWLLAAGSLLIAMTVAAAVVRGRATVRA